MKNVLIAGITFLLSCSTMAQSISNTYTDIIKKYVKIVYVERPDLPKSNSSASMTINNDKVVREGFAFTTEQKSRQPSTKIAVLINKMLAPIAKGGDEKLQRTLAALLNIKQKLISVELYADFANESMEKKDVYHTTWGIHSSMVMPKNATNIKPTAKPTHSWVWPHQYLGTVRLGEAYLRIDPRPEDERIAVIVHELSHSQDDSESGFNTVFKNHRYGMNSAHSVNELFANFHAAYKEGIANAFAFYYTGKTPIQAWNLFNQPFVYEQVPSNVCNSFINSCLDTYLASKGINTNCQNSMCFYNMNVLPTPVLLHNEFVQGSIFFGFMEKFGIEALTKILKDNQTSIKDKYGFPIVFDAMMRYASAKLGSSDKLPNKFYPVALLDYTTNWSLNKLEDYQETLRRLECRIDDIKVQEYWTKWRNKYKNAVNQSYVSGIPLF